MNLFQQTVLRKHLQQLDSEQLNQAWQAFTAFFHDAEKQTNIIASKEEQYQEGFLRDLFVAIFGYTLNPDTGYNLTTEFKNQTGAKKADGAILKDGKAVAVIELKGTDTTDLNKVEEQAFGYKNNQPHCRYVITSNFRKLRFYIDNAVAFIEWDLFTLSQADFTVLYLILHKDGLLADLPNTLKTASISQEENITKQLYRDYADFKRALFADLTAQNPQIDALTLFKKSQKLLDRLLFIFFAEDSGLLPANFARNIIIEWDKLKALKMNVPLYQRFTEYFSYLNSGYKDEHAEIFAYNGGLFRPDEVLDSVSVSDSVLEPHVKKLSDYDFASEVDVNILGHIFENSLSEIEEVTAQLAGQSIDKAQSKRKKDGVFYTPKYITKYIVENTVGKLCTDKKAELNIIDEDFYNPKRKTAAAKAKQQQCADNLNAYRAWLLQLTICDPACGSGAFLNEALSFLIAEHRYLDELESKLYGDSLVFKEVENHILENNLFGVDINEESVEIAKLSLWLRTAKRKRKLNNLSANIKCGNSLIDDPEIAGDKAFDWVREFPQVFGVNPSPFTKGGGEPCEHLQNKQTCSPPLQRGVRGDFGFDVIIGNPPYVRAELLPTEHGEYYQQTYQVYDGAGDLFSYFYELGLKIMKPNGLFGFISNTFDKTTAGKTLRHYLSSKTKIINYLDFTEVQIFKAATTYPVILILSKECDTENVFDYLKVPKTMQHNVQIENLEATPVLQSSLEANSWSFNDIAFVNVLQRMKVMETVKSRYGKCYRGIVTGYNDAFIFDEAVKNQLIEADSGSERVIQRAVEGKDINKWCSPVIQKYIFALYPAKKLNIDDYPMVKDYLLTFGKKRLEQVGGQGSRKKTNNQWFETQDSIGYWEELEKTKIIWSNLQNSNKFSFDDSGLAINAPACFLPTADKALLCILNSKLIWQFLLSICVVRSGGYIEVKPQYFEQIPIAEISDTQRNALTKKANQMLILNADLQTLSAKFLRMLARQFDITTPNKKLQKWYELDDKSFFAELEKDRKKAYKNKQVTDKGASNFLDKGACSLVSNGNTAPLNRGAAGSLVKYKKLGLAEQAEWEDYFLSEKAKAEQLTTAINSTDREIDQMVYALYGLTAEEIAVVEQSMP